MIALYLLLVQVAYVMESEETIAEAFSTFSPIKDAFPKMIIARTKHDAMQHEGVEIVDIARWIVDSQI